MYEQKPGIPIGPPSIIVLYPEGDVVAASTETRAIEILLVA